MKTCLHCNLPKEEEEFYRNKARAGTPSEFKQPCKSCTNKKAREQYTGWSGRHREPYLARYNLTVQAYNSLLEAQGGVCAICMGSETRAHPNGTVHLLSVDHDHLTGMVRGLLCGSCNRGLGMLKDSVFIVRSAANYLEAYHESHG